MKQTYHMLRKSGSTVKNCVTSYRNVRTYRLFIPIAIVLVGVLHQANSLDIPSPMPAPSALEHPQAKSPESLPPAHSTVCTKTTAACANSTTPCVNSTTACLNSSTVRANSTTVRANSTTVRANSTTVRANSTSMFTTPVSGFLPNMSGVGDSMGVIVDMSDLKFKYYNRDHPKADFLINITDEHFAEKLKKVWNYKNPELKIITHGWISSDTSLAVADIKNAYLEVRDLNVITLDWSYTASTKMYPIPAVMTYQVGSLAADVLNKLVELNFTTYDKIHMIGHSLGAHVSGSTGAHCKQKISRITGLDPAGPGFTLGLLGADRRLDVADAQFVDVIHTAAGVAGYYGALGHADFYPNSGKPPQPGCMDFGEKSASTSWFGCSHMRSYMLFSESIRNKSAFKSCRSKSWSEYLAGTNKNETDVQYMGDPLSPEARGVYYLTTNDKSPFGIVEAVSKTLARAVYC